MTERELGLRDQPKLICPYIEVVMRRLEKLKSVEDKEELVRLIDKTKRDLEKIRQLIIRLRKWGTEWSWCANMFYRSKEIGLKWVQDVKSGKIDLNDKFEHG